MSAVMFSKRMIHEQKVLDKEPLEYADAYPEADDLHKWYFMLVGPESTIYEGGKYIGIITLPKDYPFSPPSMQMLTPSGRFKIGQNICMSNLSYHPESHSAAWTIQKYLIGLISVMSDDKIVGVGHIKDTDSNKKQYRDSSEKYNNDTYSNIYNNPRFERLRSISIAIKEKKNNGKKNKLFGLF